MRGEKSNLNFSYRLMCKMTFRVMLINRHTYEGGFQQEGPQWAEFFCSVIFPFLWVSLPFDSLDWGLT